MRHFCDCRMEEEDEDDEAEARPKQADMYCKYNEVLHGPLAPGGKPPLSVPFLKKFMTIVKRRGRQVSVSKYSTTLNSRDPLGINRWREIASWSEVKVCSNCRPRMQ